MENPMKFDNYLQDVLRDQVSDQCEKIRQEAIQRLGEMVEGKLKALEAEHNSIANRDVSEKVNQLNDRFKNLEKQYNAYVEERQTIEGVSRSARMRYDKLNVRLMNSGLRIHQLLQKVEQMSPEWVHQRAVQSAAKYSEGIAEISNVCAALQRLQEERDELTTKVELVRGERVEIDEALKEAQLKHQNVQETLNRKQRELEKFCQAKAEKEADLRDCEELIADGTAQNAQLREELAQLRAELDALSTSLAEEGNQAQI